MDAIGKCFVAVAIGVIITCLSCSKYDVILSEMKTRTERCEYVSPSSPLYETYKVDTEKEIILKYVVQFPQQSYTSNCYVETLWSDKNIVYLEGTNTDETQRELNMLFKATKNRLPDLAFQFICYALVDSTVKTIVADDVRHFVLSENGDKVFDCQVQ